MYAVIKTGGKQYKVSEGQTLRVEKLVADEGSSIEINDVMMVADGDNVKVGAPFIDGSKVVATVAAHGRDKKVKIVKFRRRKHYRKQMGHRQSFTEIRIDKISG